MSEICIDCWNKYMETTDKPRKFLMSRVPELCEDCGQYKRVIIRYRLHSILLDRITEMVEDVRCQRKR